jgi:Putative DnaT-like ssDNA binding protein
MAISLVVETGQGLNNANSYVGPTLETYSDGTQSGLFQFGADQYFADRMVPTNPPNQVWFPQPKQDQVDQNAELKAACLIAASAFLDAYWRSLFKGQKKTQAQSRCWPRVGATIDEGAYDTAVVFWPGYGKSLSTFIIGTEQIPIQILECCCELASRSAALGGFTYPGELAPDINEDQFVMSEKIGPIEVVYKDQKPSITLMRKCEMLLQPILRGSGGTIPLVRG